MYILYDIVFFFFSFFYFPYLVIKRKYHQDFIQRLGIFPGNFFDRIKNHRVIWIHAVSVGEVNAAVPLWKLLREKCPGYKIVFSTITKTGNCLAKSFASSQEMVIYFPLDFSFIVKKILKIIKPSLLIILETEIWPNFIYQNYKNKTPLILVNGRMSNKAYKRYKSIKLIIKPILKKIDLILTQSDEDRKKFINLGANAERVFVTGNMKFDMNYSGSAEKDYLVYRNILGIKNNELLFIAGSTHRKEEKIILSIYKILNKEFPYLKLLIAPRHPERATEVEKLIKKIGFMPLRISSINIKYGVPRKDYGLYIFILDTVGQLQYLYAIADIVFVGGSLVRKGGHNILEPAIFSKPIISGKHYFNFSDIFKIFLENNAIFIGNDKRYLKEILKKLIRDSEERKIMGIRAKEVVIKGIGATERNFGKIFSYLEK